MYVCIQTAIFPLFCFCSPYFGFEISLRSVYYDLRDITKYLSFVFWEYKANVNILLKLQTVHDTISGIFIGFAYITV